MEKKKMIPYYGTIAGLVISIIASVIKYMHYSGIFSSRDFSLYEVISESIENPKTMLGTSDDILIFVFIILGVISLILSLVFILLKKRGSYIWIILTLFFLVFGANGKAWLHYVGLGIALVFAIWYRVLCKKKKEKEIKA